MTVPLVLLALLVPGGCGGGSNDTGSSDDRDSAGGSSQQNASQDQDNDTILDIHEGEDDADGDGIPNLSDTDSDDDGISDKGEAGDTDLLTLPLDTDGDALPDFLDPDSDNNCLTDRNEKGSNPSGGPADTDGDDETDVLDFDNDGDTLLDTVEIGMDCAVPDSDGDGTPDHLDADSDGDGIGDFYEAGTTPWRSEPADTDSDGVPDYLDTDSDDDGLTDKAESGVSSVYDEPRDTDGDGTYDFADIDSDGDGITDYDEVNLYGTDAYDIDTDGDGYSDGGELAAGTDPLDEYSVIDGIYVEVPERTEKEVDFEFELLIQMGDVAFLIDTTCSMTGTANAMASEFSSIVDVLAEAIPDAEYGVATFDDYNYGSYGIDADKPYELRQQITSDIDDVQDALSKEVQIHNGSDGIASGMEALYQGATGSGYDQGCDGNYDIEDDVYPFLASSSDPFAGGGGEYYDSGTSGGGTLGGFGFREFALPVLVYATDTFLRDPESGYGVPEGCWIDAGQTDVLAAAADLGAFLIGISVGGTAVPYPQMEDLAAETGSLGDTDGDGAIDDVLVFKWSGTDSEFRDTVTDGIIHLVSSITFERVELEIEGDDKGFVTGVTPEYYSDVGDLGVETLEFTLGFRGVVAGTTEDQLFELTLNVVGDESILLDTYDIVVVVPGSSY